MNFGSIRPSVVWAPVTILLILEANRELVLAFVTILLILEANEEIVLAFVKGLALRQRVWLRD